MKNTLFGFSVGTLLFLLSPIASADCVDYGNYMHWLGGHRAVGLGQYEKDIVVVGTTAYVVSGSGLQIVDVSTPASPVILSRIILTGGGSGAHQPTGITVVGSMAYITVAYAGLFIVNVSNLSAPAVVGILDTPSVAEDVAIAGNRAYVADYGSGLQVVDISNPANPAIIGHVDTPGNAFGVALNGNIAYLADEFVGLQVINISNPASPTILATVPNPGTVQAPGNAQDVEAVGTTVYVADGKSGLVVIDASNPVAPVMIGNVDTPGYGWDLRVQGTTVFLADDTNGLTIIDVSNPTLPVIVSSTHAPGPVRAIAVSGATGFLLGQIPSQYASALLDGLWTIALPSIATVPVLGRLAVTPPFAEVDAIAASGPLVCASHGTVYVSVFDVSNPASPVHVSFFAVGPAPGANGIIRGVALSGSMAYVTYLYSTYGGLLIVDLSAPASPQIMGHLDLPQTGGVVVSGTTAFVGASGSFPNGFTSQNHLWIVDASDPRNPTLMGGMNPPYVLPAVSAVKDSLAFSSTGSGFEVLDISNLTSPSVIGQIDLSDLGSIGGISISGNLGFVSIWTPIGGTYRPGIAALQITPFPNDVRRLGVGYAPLGEYTSGQSVSGLKLYVQARMADRWIPYFVDATNPTALSFVGNANVDAYKVVMSGNNLCAIGPEGFFVLPPQCPSSTAVSDPPVSLHPVLGTAFPNPTLAGSTTIPFTLSQPGHVTLRILDLEGRKVRTILDTIVEPGQTRAQWDGHDARGEPVPAGIYFYELLAPGVRATRKMVRLR